MNDFIEKLWNNHSPQILDVSYNVLLIIAVVIASYFGKKFLHSWIHKTNDRFERFDATLAPVLCTAVSVVVYAIGLVIILDFFGVNTTSILALLGAAGIAIALALKDTLSNIAAGMMLLILRPFRAGHTIEFGSIRGKVKEVGLFTTILETPEGLYISSPNSSLWGGPVTNFTQNGTRRMDLIVGISYSDSIDEAFAVLQSIILNEPRFLDDPAPKMMVVAMADSSVNVQLRAWATIDDYWDVYWDSTKKIKEKIEAAGLTIPFPQRDVHNFNEK